MVQSKGQLPHTKLAATHHVLEEFSTNAKEPDILPQIEKWTLERDHHFIKETNESMDTMMIFAGLFSAAITQFISSTSLGLKPDSSDLTNQLISTSIILQRNPNASIPDFLGADAFEPSNTIITINAMLFFSLILSLLSALGAMIIKQWIRRYETYGVTESLGWRRMRQRTAAQMIREDWHLERVIACIPYTLHLALAIFLTAVLVWTFTLNSRTMFPSAVLVGIAAVAYVFIGVVSFLPTTQGRSPPGMDLEKGTDLAATEVAPAPITFILNPPSDIKQRDDQQRPPVGEITDAMMWVNVIKGTEDHDALIKAFYDLRTANWGHLKLDEILFRHGKDILQRCSDVAQSQWKRSGPFYILKPGTTESARSVCLFIEWFYHQLSIKQRHSLKNWPDSAIAKALKYDPLRGQMAPPNVETQYPPLEDVTLASSVIAKLHHVRLAPGESCNVCFINRRRDDDDVRVLLAREEDPNEYDENAPKKAYYPFEKRMQKLVSACVSSDADCLLHYTDGIAEEDLEKRIGISYRCLSGCILTYGGKLAHHVSYVPLRQMLDCLQGALKQPDPRMEWFDRVYGYADKTSDICEEEDAT